MGPVWFPFSRFRLRKERTPVFCFRPRPLPDDAEDTTCAVTIERSKLPGTATAGYRRGYIVPAAGMGVHRTNALESLRHRWVRAGPVLRDVGGHPGRRPECPSTCYAARVRPASQRLIDDAFLCRQIKRVWKKNYEVYGARKLWLQLNREGVARGPRPGGAADEVPGVSPVPGEPRRAGPRCPTPPPSDPRTWCSAASGPTARTSCGSPI